MTKESLSGNIKAILFDLDGTLIDVDLKSFIPGYLKLLAESIAHLVPPRKVISKLFQASEAINENMGEKTNEEIFIQNFFPIKGYTYEDLQPIIDKFYETEFAKLRQYTFKKPEARAVVQAVFDKGYDVVIATTPVLPLTAIKQRLEWAGVGDFPYKLITSIENSKANKPNLLYYKQIIEFLGYSASECLMVGDEDKDMIALKIGCETFLVHSSNTELSSDTPVPTYQGDLIELKGII
jgi:FMN phosphatase YigB (HAD superfamily)